MDNNKIISNAIYSLKKIWLHIAAGIIWSSFLIVLYQDFKKDSLDNYAHLFINSAWIAENLIDHEISKINDSLGSSKRFFESSEAVTKEEFMKFFGPMITENPNIASVSWIPEIDFRNKDLFEKNAREYGLDDFSISEVSPTGEYLPAKARQKYYPVFYSEGVSPNHAKIGLDIGCRLDLAKLIETAISSGKTSSSSIFFINEPEKKHAESTINVLTPVYKIKESDKSLGVSGLLYFVIRLEDIMRSAKIHADQEGLSFFFSEIDLQNDAVKSSTPVHETFSKKYSQSSPFYSSSELTHTHEVILADKKYIFTFSTTAAHVSSYMRKQNLLVILLGITGLFLFFFYVKNIFSGMRKYDEFEYRKAAENLRSKSLIRSIIDSIPQGICWKDSEMTFLGCNDSFASSANLKSPDEILMMKSSEIEFLFDISGSEQVEKNILLTGKPVLHETVEICQPGGDSKWVDISRIPIIAEDGSISGILCIYDDITEAKRAERELSRTRLLLEAAFDQNPAGMILVTSGDNWVNLTNKSAFSFLGFNDGEAADSLLQKADCAIELNRMLKMSDISESRFGGDDGTPLSRVLSGEKIINEEHKIIKKNGEAAWCIINGTPIHDEKGNIMAALVVFPDITSRKEMEERLKINEEKYRALFEQSSTGFFLYNHEFEIIDCNEQFALTIGTAKEKMIGLALRKLKDQRVMPVLEKAMLGEKAFYEGDYLTTTSGLCIRVSFVALPIMNSLNEIAFGCAVVENITEKWLIQKALIEKNEELDKFFSNSLDLLCIAGLDGHFRRLNPQWATTLGYSVEAMMGRSFWDFVHPEDIEITKEAVSKLVISKEVVDFVNRYRCSDGSYKWIEWRSYPSGDTIYAAARDITARKNAEDEIRMREELFRTLSEMAPIGIFLANEMGEIVITNRRWFEITGVSADETLGNGWIRYVQHDDAALIKDVLDNSIRSICDAETIFRFVRPDGEMKNIMIKATPIIKEDGFLSGFVGTIEDITERKKNESEREHLLYEISQKNTELEGIVYAASHDLRAPLVNIQGFSIRIEKLTDELSGLIKNESDKEKCIEIVDSKIPNATNYIKISASKMDALIKGLLQVARIGRRPIVSETIDMNLMMDNILQTMAFRIQESGAKITCHSLPSCKGDLSQLNQAFSNIIDNALKYMSPEKKLEIIISGSSKEDKTVYIIEDTGIGISDEQKDKIWTMFYRSSPSGPVSGEGLGLTVVKKIIERHGGRVWAEPGENGARFFIELKSS